MLNVNDRIRIEKGCKIRGIDKGTSAQVTAVTPLGAEYSHSVRVALVMLNGFNSGKTFLFYARHMNRLNDPIVRMNDGDPLHFIEVRKVSK